MVRRVVIVILTMVSAYVVWAWSAGRLDPGAAGLLHPRGSYWVTAPLRPTCVVAARGASQADFQVTLSDARVSTANVLSSTAAATVVRLEKRYDAMPHDTTSSGSAGVVRVRLPHPDAGQTYVVQGRTIPRCVLSPDPPGER